MTQAAYHKVTGKDPSQFKGAQRPVEQVNWEEASAYCAAVEMRLPTEAEWEYSARAGAPGARYGDLQTVAWFSGNSQTQQVPVAAPASPSPASGTAAAARASAAASAAAARASAAAQKTPNAFGLHDMLGNVWEWVLDWYEEKYYERGVRTDPSGPTGGQYLLCGAGRGPTTRGPSACPSASGTNHRTGSTTLGSVVPGNCIECCVFRLIGDSNPCNTTAN